MDCGFRMTQTAISLTASFAACGSLTMRGCYFRFYANGVEWGTKRKHSYQVRASGHSCTESAYDDTRADGMMRCIDRKTMTNKEAS
jgi:hypothetical protein